MIYDEGFEVRVDGMVFFSFSYYDLVGTKNTTNCARTVRGWYHDGESYGCYQGEQTRQTARCDVNPKRPRSPLKSRFLRLTKWITTDLCRCNSSRTPQRQLTLAVARGQRKRIPALPASRWKT
jgi:hypothetical protein